MKQIFILLITLYTLTANHCTHTGFGTDTLVITPTGIKPIGTLMVGDTVITGNRAHSPITHLRTYECQNCLSITIANCPTPIICSPKQKWFLSDKKLWREAQELQAGDILSNAINAQGLVITDIHPVDGLCTIVDISIGMDHTFCISEQVILVHNSVPFVVTIPITLGSAIIKSGVVSAAIGFLGAFIGFKWHHNKNREHGENNKPGKPSNNPCSGSPNPEDPNDPYGKNNTWNSNNKQNLHPHGRYEDAPYHTQNGNSRKSPRPRDGQSALDNSISYNAANRIAIQDDAFVVLSRTSEGLYHGHVRTWDELDNGMRATLIKAGLVKQGGKIIK